jgi:hypothetical protein
MGTGFAKESWCLKANMFVGMTRGLMAIFSFVYTLIRIDPLASLLLDAVKQALSVIFYQIEIVGPSIKPSTAGSATTESGFTAGLSAVPMD